MKKKQFRIIAAILVVLLLIYVMVNNSIGFSVSQFDETSEKFTLNPGDILVRPNLNWLPGSSKVASGRKLGHVAIVVQGAGENTLDETLKKALVIEAVIFDQATRTFVLDKKKQVRKAPAIVSFGKRFEGIRYRLRLELNEQQQGRLTKFLTPRTGKNGYNLFSSKINLESRLSAASKMPETKENWNCATLAWFSVLLVSETDIDYNKGYLVYPNDLIRSQSFNSPGGCIRF